MTGPETRNGFVRIANELAEVWARYPWPGVDVRRVYDAIVRQTYGYRRKWADISQRRFCEATGLHRRSVRRALDILVSRGLVRQGAEEGALKTRRYELDSHWERWDWGEEETPERDADGRLMYADAPLSSPPPGSRPGDAPRGTSDARSGLAVISPTGSNPEETAERVGSPHPAPPADLSTDLSTGNGRATAPRGIPPVDKLTSTLQGEGFRGSDLAKEYMRRARQKDPTLGASPRQGADADPADDDDDAIKALLEAPPVGAAARQGVDQDAEQAPEGPQLGAGARQGNKGGWRADGSPRTTSAPRGQDKRQQPKTGKPSVFGLDLDITNSARTLAREEADSKSAKESSSENPPENPSSLDPETRAEAARLQAELEARREARNSAPGNGRILDHLPPALAAALRPKPEEPSS